MKLGPSENEQSKTQQLKTITAAAAAGESCSMDFLKVLAL